MLDREMWEKIVLNLLSNALKSTFEGEIRVTLVQSPGNQRPALGYRHRNRHFRKRSAQTVSALPDASRAHGGAAMRAAALAWRWCRNWWRCMAVQSKWRARWTWERRSPSPFPSESAPIAWPCCQDGANPVSLQGSAVAYVQEAKAGCKDADR